MIHLVRFAALFVMFLCMGNAIKAQQIDSNVIQLPPTIEDDQATTKQWQIEEVDSVHFQSIPEERIQRYQQDRDFQYQDKNKPVPAPNLNFFDGFVQAIVRLIERMFGFTLSESLFKTIKWFLLLCLIGVVGWALLRLTGTKLTFFAPKKEEPRPLSFEEIEENLTEVNFDKLIQQAIENEAYRVAIRLYFLKTLQKLSKNNYIEWEINKTNNDYKYELADSNIISEFQYLVYLFEHIWYGNFPLTKGKFEGAMHRFQSFQKKIQHAK